MQKDYPRANRVASLIQAEIAKLLEFELHESDFGLLTITGVEVSPDLSHAKIFIITHDETKTDEAVAFLNERAPSFRHQLGKSIRLKRLPELHFFHDKSIAEGDHIAKLLRRVDEGA